MKMTVSRYLLDSSAWLSYFFAENNQIKEVIDGENFLFTSVISLFEIKKKLIKDKLIEEKTEKFINFIKEKSIILKLDINICESAAEISIKEGLYAVDSLIYSTSISNKTKLITGDNDFRNKDNVILFKKK